MFTRCIKLAACGLALIGGLYAAAAQANSCAPAATQGTAPSDYQDYCWLDFSGYSDPIAQAGGQPFTFTLPDGSILTLTLRVSTNKASPALNAHGVPSWTGSAIGHSGFIGVPGNPVLYETVSGSTVQVVLSNISVAPPAGGGSTSSYAIIAADGESTNQGEKLIFATNGQAWTQIAQIPYGTQLPSVSGLNTSTVTETGVSGTVGAFAFGSFNNPTQITATLVGTGLQGAMFAIRYASLSVTAQFSGARASTSDQFVYSVSTAGGHVVATATTSGSGVGPFVPAAVPTVAAGYPFVVSEAMAPGSASTLASYALSLTCANAATGASSTVMPINQIGHTYTFPALQYGDAVSCTFTNTANRSNLSVLKTGPASQSAGGPLLYKVVLSNAGPLDASGALIRDPPTANFNAGSVTCSAATGGAVCPSSGLTVANIQGPGIAVPTLPSGSSVTLAVGGTAGNGSIVNLASVVAPPTLVNSNPTPTSSVSTSITPAPDAESTAVFPVSVNAGLPVVGTVLFSNIGPGIANSTTFAIVVPANLPTPPTLSGLPSGATYVYVADTGVITLSSMPNTLASGASVGPIKVSYLQPASGSSNVTANVTTVADFNLNNNKVTVAVGGAAIADLNVTSKFPPSSNAGQTVSGTLSFANGGPSTASGVRFNITLPPRLALAPIVSGLPPGAVATYNPATGIVSLTGMPVTLASGAALTAIGISYIQPNSGTSTVTGSFTSSTVESPLARQSATSTISGAAAQLVGVVFLDNNQNAVFDAGDTPIAAATVELFLGTRLIASTTTSSLGSYTFTGQTPGLYTVSVAPLPGNAGDTPSPVKISVGGAAAVTVNFGQIPKTAVGALVLTKSTPLVNVTAGQSVPYTITASNSQTTPLPNISLTDLMPVGFRFRAGSGTVNGQRQDPVVNGRLLTWPRLRFAAGEKKIFTLVLTTGAGVVGGDYVNQSTGYNGATNALISNLASATVRVVGDPTFDCPDLIGKVFDDANANGTEDPGEQGIAGVRLVTAQGLLVTTDAQGRYHIACPVMPGDLGTNFILKLDERTLPSGYRLTTDNPETIRLTAGKVSKLNFGATIHHVVRIEVNDAAFLGNELRVPVLERIDVLVTSMKERAFVVRLAYAVGAETEATISLRMQALRMAVIAVWKTREVTFPLRIEEDIVRGGATP